MGKILRAVGSISQKILIMVFVYCAIAALFMLFTRDTNQPLTHNIHKDVEKRMYETINDPEMKKTIVGRNTLVFYRFALCTIVGMTCTNNPADNDKLFDHSLIGFMTNTMSMTYTNPPASGIAWVSQGLQDSGFIPRTYAAEGIGFASIKGYAQIWNLFRNLTYFVLVLIIVTIGFLIMFRVKINPQTVISIENAIPRIFMTLIFITFSFALAGFLIDAMYVIIAIGIGVLAQLNLPNTELRPDNVKNLIGDYITSRMGGIWPFLKILGQGSLPGSITSASPLIATGNAFFNLLPDIIKEPFKLIASFYITASVAEHLTKNVNKITGPFRDILGIGDLPDAIGMVLYFIIFYTLAGWMPGIVLGFLMIYTLFLLIFQIFILLIAAYIRIVLMIVFAPVLIMLEAIPGQHAFSAWVRNLFGELLTFPLIIILSLTGYALVSINYNSQVFTLPFLYGLDAGGVSMITGMAILFVSPKLVAQIKQKIGVKGGVPVPLNPGTFFGPAIGAVQSARMMVGTAFPTLLTGINPNSALVRFWEATSKDELPGPLKNLGKFVNSKAHAEAAKAEQKTGQAKGSSS